MSFRDKVLSIIKSPLFKRICGSVFGFVLLLCGTVLIPCMLYFIPRFPTYSGLMIGEHNDIIEVGTALVSMPVLFYVLAYTTAVGDCLLYDKWRTRTDGSVSKLLFVLSQPIFLIKSAIFALIYLGNPTVKLFPAMSEAMKKLGIERYDLPAKLLLLLILFALAICAVIASIGKWEEFEEAIPKKPLGYVSDALTRTVTVFLSGIALIIFVPIIVRLAPIAKELLAFNFTKAIIAICIIAVILSYLRALNIRRKCLKRLYTLCTGRKRRCDKVRRAYLSVFFPSASLPFDIKIGDKAYSCKLISGRRLYTRMRINAEGYGEYVFPVRIGGITLIEFKRTIYFDIDSPHKKIIVFNPSPHYIYIEERTEKTQIDNGAQIGEYKIYNATAFLNSIERDCLGE